MKKHSLALLLLMIAALLLAALLRSPGAPTDALRPAIRGTNTLIVLEETFQRRKATLGANNTNTLAAMRSLGAAYLAAKQFTNAEALLRPFVERTRQVHGVNSPSLGDALVLLGECRLRQGRFKAAESPLREALPILEKEQPGLSPAFNTESLLGWALLGQKKFAEAEPLVVKSYEGLKERDARRPDRSRALVLKEAGERVVQLYEAWGKPNQAAEWRQKLSEATPTAKPR